MKELFLLKDVESLGKRGDTVTVADGYARNYLLPKKLAILAGQVDTSQLENMKKRIAKEQAQKMEDAKKFAEMLSEKSVSIMAAATEEGHLFGSVTEKEIAEALKNDSIEIDPESIVLEKPIKEIGVYDVPVKLHHDLKVELKVWVVRE